MSNWLNSDTNGNFKALQAQQSLGTIGNFGNGIGALVSALNAAGDMSAAYGQSGRSDDALGVGGKELQQQAKQQRQAWSESAGALVSVALAAMAFML